MRALAFPDAANFDREQSYENGTPFSSSNTDDIPIDPALASIPIDPALLGPDQNAPVVEVSPPVLSVENHLIRYNGRLSQGPQGDPFATQALPLYFPMSVPTHESSMLIPKPPRKKRKVAREKECGFCQGSNKRNRNGVPEQLLTCAECGRSGHPTCLQISELGGIVYEYDWHCVECKFCEFCREKGDESRILFCDVCDRGWHMDCLQPPLAEAPSGDWSCPNCPQRHYEEVLQEPYSDVPIDHAPESDFLPPPTPKARGSSVASSSRSAPRSTRSKQKWKGKAKAITSDDSEVDADGEPEADYDVEETPVPIRSAKSLKKARTPSKLRRDPHQGEADTEPEPPKTIRKMRLRIFSPVPPPRPTPVIRLKLSLRSAKGKEREEEPAEESKGGMFDDLLSAEDRDVTQTSISGSDKQRFEKSRQEAERAIYPPRSHAALEAPDTPIAGPSSRPLRSSLVFQPHTPGPSESPAPSTPDLTKTYGPGTLRIRSIRFGEFDIQTWYDAPFPEEYANLPDGRLWICEFCLKYMKSQFVASRHQTKCKMRHPPGDEIYRDGSVSIFEVDGRKNKIYCQNLCLLSKMFLDHKSLFYDVEPFLFYVMTEVDETIGPRFVGYFSKEKRSPKDYNVSCIMTLPVRQRQGWGNLLIDFSYLLSKKEGRTGSPEKPLSALGALGYKNYWTLALMRYLRDAPDNPQLEDIAKATSITIEDLHATLQQQQMIIVRDETPPARPLPGKSIKIQRGKKNGIARRHLIRSTTQDSTAATSEHGLLNKGPFVPPQQYDITWDPDFVEAYLAKWEAKGYLKLRPECLKWSPFLVARTMKTEALPQTDADAAVASSVATNRDPGKIIQVLETPGGEDLTPNLETDEGFQTGTPRSGIVAGARSERISRTRGLRNARSFPKDRARSVPNSGAVASPAFLNLFDEPIGEVVRSSSSRLPPKDSDTLPTLSKVPAFGLATPRHTVKHDPDDDGTTITPRSLKRRTPRAAPAMEATLRRSSRHSMTTASTSPSQVPPQPSPQAPSTAVEVQKPRGRGRPRKIRPALPPPPQAPNGKEGVVSGGARGGVDMTADDATLAAKLALEDEVPRRQLRSRSNTAQDILAQVRGTHKRGPLHSPSTPTVSIPPRKRRRMEDEGEDEGHNSEVPSTPLPMERMIHTRRSAAAFFASQHTPSQKKPPVPMATFQTPFNAITGTPMAQQLIGPGMPGSGNRSYDEQLSHLQQQQQQQQQRRPPRLTNGILGVTEFTMPITPSPMMSRSRNTSMTRRRVQSPDEDPEIDGVGSGAEDEIKGPPSISSPQSEVLAILRRSPFKGPNGQLLDGPGAMAHRHFISIGNGGAETGSVKYEEAETPLRGPGHYMGTGGGEGISGRGYSGGTELDSDATTCRTEDRVVGPVAVKGTTITTARVISPATAVTATGFVGTPQTPRILVGPGQAQQELGTFGTRSGLLGGMLGMRPDAASVDASADVDGGVGAEVEEDVDAEGDDDPGSADAEGELEDEDPDAEGEPDDGLDGEVVVVI